jgi:uncharacterized protein
MSIVLTELNIYPIKSAKGIAVQTVAVEKTGLAGDRRWMVVDNSSKFMTQRHHPRMALIEVKLEAGHLVLMAPEMEPLPVPFPYLADPGSLMQVEVWGDFCMALSAGSVAQGWLSQFLGMSCQLVYMPDSSIRPVDPNYAIAPDQNQVSFADAYPFLLISEASLQDLNDRLETPIPMNRFRPNLVVKGCEPFAEDRWRKIRVGAVVFHVVKPCDRCVIPTVDQATGIKGKEPLLTLAQYRLKQGKILFGQNLLHHGSGLLSVGGAIEILESADP